MHELVNVLRQLENDNGNFVLDYAAANPTRRPTSGSRSWATSPPVALPALHELARHFTVCDHWYSSVPGPTWANRFFVHSGTSLGRVQMPGGVGQPLHPSLYFGYDQDTIYDRLNERGHVLAHLPRRHPAIPRPDPPAHRRERQALPRHGQFFTDASGPEERFPAYCFIEPSYYWPGQNDDHPPHTTMRAQALLANVYNALRQNEPLWESTLLVVLYDEHGGFYDHVPPPAAVPPDGHPSEYRFDRLGVRVPALLVSPWVDRAVVKTDFDHTSLLKYLTEKWNLGPLTERVAEAASFGPAIRTTGRPRDDTPPSVAIPVTAVRRKG